MCFKEDIKEFFQLYSQPNFDRIFQKALSMVKYQDSSSYHDNQTSDKILETICSNNGFSLINLVNNVTKVFDKDLPKINGLVFHGEPNSGKSYIVRSLAELAKFYWEINDSGVFMWQSLVACRFGLVEEPNLTPSAIEMLKKIAEGHRTRVQIKNKQDSWSERVAIIVTTNDFLWCHALSTEPALRSKFYFYENMKMAKKKWFGKKKLNPKVWQYLYETTKPTTQCSSEDDTQFDDNWPPPVFTLRAPKRKKETQEVHPGGRSHCING